MRNDSLRHELREGLGAGNDAEEEDNDGVLMTTVVKTTTIVTILMMITMTATVTMVMSVRGLRVCAWRSDGGGGGPRHIHTPGSPEPCD